MWVEIFKGGKQKDKKGLEHDGDQIIEAALSSFDASKHMPPLVLGRPTHSSPAYGWVHGLKQGFKDGVKTLMASIVPIEVSGLKEWATERLREGPRTVSFYNNGSALRSVSIQGIIPSHLKKIISLPDFGDDDKEAIIFMENNCSASEHLNDLVAAKLAEKPHLSFSAAFSEVQVENQELAYEYSMSVRP